MLLTSAFFLESSSFRRGTLLELSPSAESTCSRSGTRSSPSHGVAQTLLRCFYRAPSLVEQQACSRRSGPILSLSRARGRLLSTRHASRLLCRRPGDADRALLWILCGIESRGRQGRRGIRSSPPNSLFSAGDQGRGAPAGVERTLAEYVCSPPFLAGKNCPSGRRRLEASPSARLAALGKIEAEALFRCRADAVMMLLFLVFFARAAHTPTYQQSPP